MSLMPPPSDPAIELIFGLVAPIGVDLDMVSDALDTTLREMNYQTHSLRITKLMEDLRVEIPSEIRNGMLSNLSYVQQYQKRIAHANAIRAQLGDDSILAAIAVSAIRTFRDREWTRREASGSQRRDTGLQRTEEPLPNQAYIIRQLKRPEEVALLREIYGKQFILISAYAPQEWRVKRIEKLELDSRGGLLSAVDAATRAQSLVLQDARESQDTHGQNVRDAFALGDVFIDATSRSECEPALRRFIHLLFGSNEITPTHDEYGIYIAKSASLRSSDLSRQVGAAIFRQSGEVLTLGCNEVPKASGGTYWTGDSPDGRDFVQGRDPNDVRKRQVLVDIVDRLLKGGHLSKDLAESSTDANEITKRLLAQSGPESLLESRIMDLIEFGRIVHAEMSALSDAARKGVSVEGATLYSTTFPCHLCAKLIVAAGINRVIYQEPYPKSYAFDLHSDAITVDAQPEGVKVAFNAFIGVSPFRYRDLFEKRKRKNQSGIAQRWQRDRKIPFLNVLYPSYFKAESHVVGLLGELTQKSAYTEDPVS